MKKGLNASQIKLIAIIAMTIDHLTWTFFPGQDTTWYVYALHIIGRLTAPIMWFFIAEGCHYTHNIKKYAGRLFGFAIISHFAYNFAFGIPFVPFSNGSFFNQTSVMWSLAWAVVAIAVARVEKLPWLIKVLLIALISVIVFPSDWSSIAVMCVLWRCTLTAETKRNRRLTLCSGHSSTLPSTSSSSTRSTGCCRCSPSFPFRFFCFITANAAAESLPDFRKVPEKILFRQKRFLLL